MAADSQSASSIRTLPQSIEFSFQSNKGYRGTVKKGDRSFTKNQIIDENLIVFFNTINIRLGNFIVCVTKVCLEVP